MCLTISSGQCLPDRSKYIERSIGCTTYYLSASNVLHRVLYFLTLDCDVTTAMMQKVFAIYTIAHAGAELSSRHECAIVPLQGRKRDAICVH